MSAKLLALSEKLKEVFGGRIGEPVLSLGELTVDVAAAEYHEVARTLRDHADFRFEQLVDLSGIDYSAFACGTTARRYAAACHLLSVSNNFRLRLLAFADDDNSPVLSSVVDLWHGANWYEREAYDLYGIVFEGHPDLRRILTDYGFVGHPFRKDFPVSGYVEMRYDAEQRRVVYQPVTIEPREVTPRIVREENYGRG
jgi:NADH-quinone oxidoreductase subunit C